MTLAQAEPVFLMSIVKPLLVAALLVGWAWVGSHLDKDAGYFYLPRRWTNLGLIAAAALAFLIILMVPLFWIGLFIGLVILLGSFFGYAYYRNTKVPADRQWNFSLASFTQRLDAMKAEQAQKRATVTLIKPSGEAMPVPAGNSPNTSAHATLEAVIDFALPRGASQIDLLVDAKEAAMVARVDGVNYPQPALEPKAAVQLMDYLKTAAGMDLQDRRRKQSAKLQFEAGDNNKHVMEIVTDGSTRQLNMSMVLDKGERSNIRLDDIGLLAPQLNQLRAFIQEPGKVVLVGSPPGQGMTTTLYSLVQEHDPYISGIVTLEDTLAFEIEGVNHNVCGDSMAAPDINEKLGALVRSDPQIILISKVRDANMARQIAQSAGEIRFYVGLPAEDTLTALRTWIKAIGDKRGAARHLGAIVCQRLVRKLCITCRTAYKPDPASVKKLNLPPTVTQLYAASGKVLIKDKEQTCPTCVGIGYRGRVAIFEVMVLDDQARQLAAAGDLERLRAHTRKLKMMLMQEAALHKVFNGITDIKEITRALRAERKSSRPAPQSKTAS